MLFSLSKYSCLALACILFAGAHAKSATPATLSYKILEEKAHDPVLFTQGLIVQDNVITESSGLYGRSFLRRYHAQSGKLIREIPLPKAHFGEGLTKVDNLLYLLTWRAGIVYILDEQSLQPKFKMQYRGEGWGLTYNGSELIMSDGSARLYYRKKSNFQMIRNITVKNNQVPVSRLNELEYAKSSIWANVWQSTKIIRIKPETGAVSGILDLENLVNANSRAARMTLNGIAYDKKQDAFWLTGKLWPKRYLVKIFNPDADNKQ